MKKTLSTICLTALGYILSFAQTNENKPLHPENIKFYLGESKQITDNTCDCNTSEKKTVIVKVKVTKEMFNYDMVQVGVRYSDGNYVYGEKTQISKSDFKNKYNVGDEISYNINYSNFCITDFNSNYSWDESKKYKVEVIGGNITTYEEVYVQAYNQYVKNPVYGDYDYLARSDDFTFIMDKKAMEDKIDADKKKRAQEKREEHRNKILVAAGTSALIGLVIIRYIVYHKNNPS